MRRILERLLALLWTGFAVLLIGGAALVTLVRIALPQVDAQRGAVEAWLTEMVGRPVKVGAINANWSGWAPRLSFERLVILDVQSKAELIHFERADIDIALLDSITRRELKPTRLVVSGVAMNLIRDRDGRFTVAGMPPPRSPVMRWLLEQDNLVVRQAELTVNDQRAQANYALSGLMLSIHSRGTHKTITAYVDLPDMIGRHATLEMRTRGNPLDPQWEGNIDARLDGINSGYLLRQVDWHGPLPDEVPVNLVAWSQWRDGRLRYSDFEIKVERAGSDNTSVLEARGQLLKHKNNWRLALADITLPGVVGTKGNGRLSAQWRHAPGEEPRLALRAAALPLGSLAALARHMSAPGPLRDGLARVQLRGRLARLDALWAPRHGALEPRFFVAARVAGFAARDAARPRTLEGLSFEMVANGGGGHVAFDDAAFKLSDSEHLPAALDVTSLQGALSWRQRGGAPLVVRAHELQAQVAGTRIALAGSLQRTDAGAPVLDLEAHFATDDATHFKTLLPAHLLPAHGEQWFRQLFESGRIEAGHLVLQGPLDRFPYADKSGQFSADFSVREARLRYAHLWPAAQKVDGELSIRGARLQFDVKHGTVSGADIAGATIVLPDFGVHDRMVQIKGVARGPAASAIELVANSPLQYGRAGRLTDLEISGAIEVPLNMNLALYLGGPHEVQGEAHFVGNQITELKQRLTLDDVVGTIAFTHHDWHGAGLRAVFDGTPVDLAINGALHDTNYDSEFQLSGVSPAAGLLRYLHKYAAPVYTWLDANQRLGSLTGTVPWQAVLSVPSAAGIAAGRPQRLVLDSSLAGLAIDLPWPLAKRAEQTRAVRIEADIQDHMAIHTRVYLRDALSMELDAARDPDGRARLTRAEVVFGSLEPEFRTKPGISLSGYIALLPLNEWARIVQRMPDGTRGDTDALPVKFDLQVSDLRLLGRKFKDVRLSGEREAARWKLLADGPDVSGRIEIPRDASLGVLRLDLQHLHVRRALKRATAGKTTDLDPRRLPAFEMHCAEFSYGKMALGQADISTSRHAAGLTLDKLHFKGQDFDILATGDWLVDDDAHRSKFDIAVTAAALGPLLSRFGYRVANIKHGKTEIDIQANWPGTPADFALAHINGSFQLQVNNGRFLDIDPGTGRLFGLLSLQALPRRLTLNFEDLFTKGFVFDRIAGVFQLQDGNAYTNNLLIDGPSARFEIAGRTGLAAKDYDQHVVVTPALPNSLPLAGALFGPIGVGAGAAYYIGSKMFKSIPERMNQFLSRRYTITGSWDNPVVTRI